MEPTIKSDLPSPFFEKGAWFRQNIPNILDVGTYIDHTLPPGTIEVWQDGKRIGRIENIGIR